MIQIKIYDPSLKGEWDNFVSTSKNATFMLMRDFMDYHSHRFQDLSLLFYKENKLQALLPANMKDSILYSHQGLSYAGLLMGIKTTAAITLQIFEALVTFCKQRGINKIVYKAIPHIYHSQAGEEDLYALFRNNAKLTIRAISSCIYLEDRIRFAEIRRRCVKKALQNNLLVEEADDFSAYWKILSETLRTRHGVDPVHSLDEINLLKERFPDNIRLFQAKKGTEILAGVLVFEMKQIAHAQYISSNDSGRDQGALDIIFSHLIGNVYSDKKYFDFGISTEKQGIFLNEGLIAQKEGFGGRGVVYNTYEILIS